MKAGSEHIFSSNGKQFGFYAVLIFLTGVQISNARLNPSFLRLAGTTNTIINKGNPTLKGTAAESALAGIHGERVDTNLVASDLSHLLSGNNDLLYASLGLSDAKLDQIKGAGDTGFYDSDGKWISNTKGQKTLSAKNKTLQGGLQKAPSFSTAFLTAPSVAEGNIVPCSEDCAKAKLAAKKAVAMLEKDALNDSNGLNTTESFNAKNAGRPLKLGNGNFSFGGGPTTNGSGAFVATGHGGRSASLPSDEEGSPINLRRAPASSTVITSPTAAHNSNSFDPEISLAEASSLEKFSVAPEGWFAEELIKGSGIYVRGALDRSYDKDDPENPDNFLQIVVSSKVSDNLAADYPGLKNLEPGVYTLKKCDMGCHDEDYERFYSYLNQVQADMKAGHSTGTPAKRAPPLPGLVEILSQLGFRDAAEIKEMSSKNIRTLKTATRSNDNFGKRKVGQRSKWQDFMNIVEENRIDYRLN